MDDEYKSLMDELDVYTSFFRGRAAVQEAHHEALAKLLAKSEEERHRPLDSSALSDTSTAKSAWLGIRQGLRHEIDSNREFVRSTHLSLSNLLSFQAEKDRTRKAIREQAKTAAQAHSSYLLLVARLRKTYERKVEEYEEAMGEADANDGESDGGTRELRRFSTSSTNRDSSPPIRQSFVSGATSSTSTSSAFRDAPPAKSNVFDALNLKSRDWTGERSKVNSVIRAIGNVAKGDGSVGSVGAAIKSSVGGGKHEKRKEVVRLKREAEQADREYRDAIYRLDTLRIQRNRMTRTAASSISELCHELSSHLRDVFGQYTDNLIDLGRAEIAIGEHAKHAIAEIDPIKDATSALAAFAEPVFEPPVYYVNYFVGECRSLLFGISLVDYVNAKPASSTSQIPLIVRRCIDEIEQRCLDFQGIYRISPKASIIQRVIHEIEKDEVAFSFKEYDPPTIAAILKLYLRQLPTPVLPFPTSDRIAFSATFSSDSDGHLASLARRIKRLPIPNQLTLKAVIEHLSRVAANHEINYMNISNLAIVFSSCIFGEDSDATLESTMNAGSDIVLETLINHRSTLFDGIPFESAAVSRSRATSISQGPFFFNSSAKVGTPGTPGSIARSSAPSSPQLHSGSLHAPGLSTLPAPRSPSPLSRTKFIRESSPPRPSRHSLYSLHASSSEPVDASVDSPGPASTLASSSSFDVESTPRINQLSLDSPEDDPSHSSTLSHTSHSSD